MSKAARMRSISDIGVSASAARAESEALAASSASKRLKKSPRGGPPVSAPIAPAGPASRRSASVDVHGVASRRKSWVDEEGDEMIVDLGQRRRAASEAGTPPSETTNRAARARAVANPANGPQSAAVSPSSKRPADVFGPTTSTKGYASDTEAMQPKKKSLTKKREQQTVPAAIASTVSLPHQPTQLSIPSAPPPILATPTATPMRKASVKSTAPRSKSPLSQPQPQPQQAGPATILAAGGEHPSGVLGSGKKTTALGHGVGGSGGVARRASLSGASPGKAEAPSRSAASIKAPGSVFEQRQADVGRQSMQVQQPSSSAAGQSIRAESPARAGAATNGYHQPAKGPLRSALRNSRPSSLQHGDLSAPPPPVAGDLPWGSDGTLHQPRKADKGKATVRPTHESETDQSGDESNEVFYSDLEEVETASKTATPAPQVPTESSAPAPVALGGMNGHAIGHTKTFSEVSQSSTSTFIPGSSSSAQPRVPPLASEQQQTPRRRKSVRVSLQPTFSPSPPAIEYDDDEEQRLHAPWAWKYESSVAPPAPQPLAAPVPLRAPVKTVASQEAAPDMWADSSDEDEQKERDAKALRLI
ncbi:hypothetical protein BJ912DRAFT_989819, partial [Pholiota molesta]